MNKRILTFLLFSAFIPFISQAEERLITDAGREVIINDDGSWSFASDDRYATNSAGERVKLKANGSWEVLAVDENLSSAYNAVYRNAPSYQSAIFELDKVVIESTRTRATLSSKNPQLRNQTVFYVLVSVPESETQPLVLTPTIDSTFTVTDTSDKEYPTLSISPSSFTIGPGEESLIEVRVDGAPSWKYGKSYEFKVSADILASERDLVLRIPLSETRKNEVESFPINP